MVVAQGNTDSRADPLTESRGRKENMRYHDRSKLALGQHRLTLHWMPLHSARVWVSLFASVSVLAMMTAEPARAQYGDFAVDVSDPSISIDLSVLDDGGVSASSNLPMSPSSPVTGGAHQASGQAPGPDLPVSTLYIQPSESFTLPQQTKSLIAKSAPEVEPTTDIVEDVSMPEEPYVESVAEATPDTVPEAPALEETVAEEPVSAPEIAAPAAPAAPTPETIQKPVQETAAAEPEPAPAPEPEPAVAAPAPASIQETVKAEPAPAPEPAPMKEVAKAEPSPAPEPLPEPMPEATPTPAEPEVAVDAATQVPPPPQALTQTPQTPPATPPQAPTQQAVVAPPAAPGAVVVDLPPKLEEQQPGVASLPSATGPLSDGDTMRIVFEHDSSKLPSDVRDALKALSDRLGQQDSLRLQLLAYAGDNNTSASAARRLSLSRALAVRSYLIENGVRSTRIDVRALGNKSTEAVTERVDITIVER